MILEQVADVMNFIEKTHYLILKMIFEHLSRHPHSLAVEKNV